MQLDWDGFVNARDLGSIRTSDGSVTRCGAVVRSEHPSLLTPTGWSQLIDYGVRTILSLETGGLEGEAALRNNRPVMLPVGADVMVRSVPVEDGCDQEFMNAWARTGLWGTPLYFADALRRWPNLYGAALTAVAESEGIVLIHCGRGQDRTGILAMLLLALAGVDADAITEDYLLSSRSLESRDANSVTGLDLALAGAGTTARDAIAAAVAVVDDDYLSRAGVSEPTRAKLYELLRRPVRSDAVSRPRTPPPRERPKRSRTG